MITGQDVISDLTKELMMKNLITFRKDIKTWQVCFTHPHIKGKRIKKNTPYTFHEKTLARKLAEEMYAEIKVRHTHSNLYSDHTLGEAIDEYMNSKQLGKTDIGILNAIKGELGNKDIKHINKQDYKTLIRLYLKNNNAYSTIDRKFDILKAVLNEAIENEWLDKFPKIKKLDKSNKDEKGHRLSLEEKTILLNAMNNRYQKHLIDPFLFALATGLRRRNIQNLKKSHIVQTINGKELRFVASEMKWKTKHSISLTKDMERIINRNITDDSDYVFRGYKNKKKLGNFKRSWNNVRAKAGVLNPNTGKYVRWHDLRHTTASDYAEKGLNPYSLMKLMHWQSLAMAERYVHNNANTQRADLERFKTKIVPDLSHTRKTGHNRQRL
ncbi:tyrosine-type recombinase/integrase [Pseudomonadota bacterium]|nr:tyrosine-type recombinase/integrase [Pseudomonadota bacterium]